MSRNVSIRVYHKVYQEIFGQREEEEEAVEWCLAIRKGKLWVE